MKGLRRHLDPLPDSPRAPAVACPPVHVRNARLGVWLGFLMCVMALCAGAGLESPQAGWKVSNAALTAALLRSAVMAVKSAAVRAVDGKIIVSSIWRTTRYDASTVDHIETRVGWVNTWRRIYPVIYVGGRKREITTCNFQPTGPRADNLERAVAQLNAYIACAKAAVTDPGPTPPAQDVSAP